MAFRAFGGGWVRITKKGSSKGLPKRFRRPSRPPPSPVSVLWVSAPRKYCGRCNGANGNHQHGQQPFHQRILNEARTSGHQHLSNSYPLHGHGGPKHTSTLLVFALESYLALEFCRTSTSLPVFGPSHQFALYDRIRKEGMEDAETPRPKVDLPVRVTIALVKSLEQKNISSMQLSIWMRSRLRNRYPGHTTYASSLYFNVQVWSMFLLCCNNTDV